MAKKDEWTPSVGDRVRVISEKSSVCHEEGVVTPDLASAPFLSIRLDMDGRTCLFWPDELEFIG